MKSGPVPYHLGKFPPTNIDWAKLVPLIGPANASLARFDGLLSAIPNAHTLLSPLTTQEAVLSSKIEGTHVTMGEVLEIEAGGDSERITQPKREDAEEVLNYRHALQACTDAMKNRPFSQQVLRSAHGLLMKGVRGRDKTPGSYRLEQNFIGLGNDIKHVKFIPIAPEHLQVGMDVWEHYVGSESEPDALVQLAVLHAEFEALHPFKDGNGRLGRMLIPLFLSQRKLLGSPDFYMSGYLESNREEYYERLRSVSRDGDWTSWCEFFLRGVSVQAAENGRKAREILSLYERVKQRVAKQTRSPFSISVVDFIFKTPTFTAPMFGTFSGIAKQTASRILSILCEKRLLRPLQARQGRRAAIYVFPELLNIAEGKKVF